MNQSDLIEIWKREEKEPFIGWDFSHLDGRMLEEQPPWSYSTRAGELLDSATSALDMGTGGGEQFLALRSHWPRKVAVTEDYLPNLRLARERLSPLGVQVCDVNLNNESLLPFREGEFDLILNRHDSFNPREVARVLPTGGTFFTQQVHGQWAYDLEALFGAKPQWPDSTLEKDVPRLQAAGLTVTDRREWSGSLGFTDVGAIVYYLKAVPWLVPGFSVEKHLDILLDLQRRLERREKLSFWIRKYLIEAHK